MDSLVLSLPLQFNHSMRARVILLQQNSDHVLPLLRMCRRSISCRVKPETLLSTGLQDPTWFSAAWTVWPYPSPPTPFLSLLQPLWYLHRHVKKQTHSCLRTFPPAVLSARKAVPSNTCVTSWRTLLITLYRNGMLDDTYGHLLTYLLIVCLSPWTLLPLRLLSAPREQWLLPILYTAVSPTPGRGSDIKLSINVLEWINEWIYTVVWEDKYFPLFFWMKPTVLRKIK